MVSVDEAERARLESLRRTGLLDSRPEPAYEAIVELAREVADTPIALVSLVDLDRQWFKARRGLDADQTTREVAFCNRAIEQPTQPMVVSDASVDPRFANNPLVTGDPGVRFYAGFPITDEDGHGLGTLCVIDRQPRQLSDEQERRLVSLGQVAQELVRLRVLAKDLDDARSRAQLFERGFDNSGTGQQLVGRDGRLLRVNKAFASMIGRSVDELLGQPWWEFSHPEDAAIDLRVEHQLDTGELASHRSLGRYVHSSGRTVWATVDVVPVFLEGSNERINYVQITDVSDTVEAKLAADRALGGMIRSEARLNSLIEPSPDPVLLLSIRGIIEAANPAAVEALSSTGDTLVGMHASQLPLADATYRALKERVHAAFRSGQAQDVDRVWFEPVGVSAGWYRVRIFPVTSVNGSDLSAFITAVEVTEAIRNEHRLSVLALVDPLTGAANRTAFYEHLERAFAKLDRRSSAGVGIAMIDLDRFKALNDTYGHEAGDLALCHVVTTLREAARKEDVVVRFGGDEFVVLFDDVTEEELRESIAPHLATRLRRIELGMSGGGIHTGGSLGVSWTAAPTAPADLLREADRELLERKRHTGGRSYPAFIPPGVARPAFPDDNADELALRYQPIVDHEDRLVGVKAVPSWESAPTARTGKRAMQRMIFDAGLLAQRVGCAVELHIKLGPAEIADRTLAAVLQEALQDQNVDPCTVVLDVAELPHLEVRNRSFDAWTLSGVGVMLDDFGTGPSSLNALRQRPLRGIKLARTFVGGVAENEIDRAIVAGLMAMAHGAGLQVIADGVNDDQQRQWLTEAGCRLFQGGLIGPAVGLDELELPGAAGGNRSAAQRR